MSEAFGVLAVDKPGGMTSHDLVAQVRRGTSIRRVGHAGTLDPMATGVLVVCVGGATRLSEYLMASEKVYQAVVRLGIETNTYDAEGEIVEQRPLTGIAEGHIRAALARFEGLTAQIPPMYSAIKKGGRKLYELARQGEVVDRAPRQVEMHIRVIAVALPDVHLEVTCSAGTYIRSLAHDLGAALDTGAHLAALRRTRSGALADPIVWETLKAAFAEGTWPRLLIDARRALPSMAEVRLSPDAMDHVRHGRPIGTAGHAVDDASICRAHDGQDRLVAILERRHEAWWPIKVFEG